MWKWLVRRRAHCIPSDAPPAVHDVASAKTVLFAVFARYGDSIIAFKLIRAFIAAHPDKKYWLITSPQALPYAQALLPVQIRCLGFNKHRDLFRLVWLWWTLRHERFDLGLNPWSHGKESEFFITYAKKFYPYARSASYERTHNLYDRVRRYLDLPASKTARPIALPANARHIVLSPFSTDLRKSLNKDDIVRLLDWLRRRYANARITLALLPQEAAHIADVDVERFVFGKSRSRSLAFLALLRQADLMVGVDAGPLHLADALGVPTIGIFGPTAPETILDVDSGIIPMRLAKMHGWFCDIRDCKNAVCLHQLIAGSTLEPVHVEVNETPVLEVKICRAL